MTKDSGSDYRGEGIEMKKGGRDGEKEKERGDEKWLR
jgi:hypothetical protein